jgi:hypothetical protein
MALDGDDLRRLPLSMRKTNLARLLARRPDGIFVAPFEQGEIGPDLFRAACRMGLEGLVSKRRDRPYQAGRSKHWVKVKNRKHPATERELEWLVLKPPRAPLLIQEDQPVGVPSRISRDRVAKSALAFETRKPGSNFSSCTAASFADQLSRLHAVHDERTE